MKKWTYILSIMIWITQINSVEATDKIAIVNISNIFQQSSQRAKIIKQLEYEFKDRAAELEKMEHDLQIKIQTLQRDGTTMKAIERNELEKSLINQREIFTNKAKEFQQENHSRQTEERDKILNMIHNVVSNVAKKENYDIVIDSNAVVYHSVHITDITNSVMKQVG
ncbi:OmpH family outer membrane protein [Blochmannia endosymbiont of Camponotus sp. C-003]|uniref:OmpH family outer membrane protein n=1 Tax=unclassified Candidatus Blochmanniella TaxID=711328 RepID=UPI0020241586|nr:MULTISPECIES: OmpH family outer membrane protein [unclassified Candidatus Blochmannia]URJ23528.1 OmpH family outer membrane protein [Blochmannia endosymbiont of Camponotus sp. C-003]URJ29000.1 OmpH family outer membrane protein [Blochmannia endosymbiont of Camponotus sp. C-046]